MSNTEAILSAIVVALLSGIFGKYLGEKSKVSSIHCSERQMACRQLILEKLNNMEKSLKALTEVVNDKVLGI